MLIANRRGLRSLFPPTQRRPARLFLIGFAVAVGFGLLGLAFAGAISPIERSPLTIGEWLAWAPLGVALLLLQTGAEEAVFRGYLLQQLAARFRGAWWAWALIPSVLFGALHFNPLAPGGAWVIVAVTTLGGFMLAVVTARTGGIAAAWGIHMGVNTMALLIVGPPDYLSGLSLWRLTEDETTLDRLALFDFFFIAAAGLAAAWWFRPKTR